MKVYVAKAQGEKMPEVLDAQHNGRGQIRNFPGYASDAEKPEALT